MVLIQKEVKMRHAPPLEHGWLDVITGCMYSGKTEKLIQLLNRFKIAGQSVFLFKPTTDDRDSLTKTVSHSTKQSFPSKLIKPGAETLPTLVSLIGKEALEGADVIAFDEGNFFSVLLVDLCEKLVQMEKRVIVAGLNQTFAGVPYSPMDQILAHADEVKMLNAVCVVCGGIATKSQRLIDGEPAKATSPQDIVGGEEQKETRQGVVTYEARCRKCHEVR